MLTFSFTLIRHGETQYNRDKLLQGQGVDTPLSETGVLQAEAAGQYLQDITYSKVFVSNLQRAVQHALVDQRATTFHWKITALAQQSQDTRSAGSVNFQNYQTAEIILRNNTQCSDMELTLEPLLRERGFGVAEGRHKEDLKNMANAAGQSCRDYTPPGGETLEQVKQRFKKFLKVLLKQMLEDHCPSDPDAGPAATSGGAAADGTSATLSCPSANTGANDGLQGVAVHVLAVSHGAYIRVATRHLVEDLKCSLPAGVKVSQLFSPCPNTGISRFIFSVSRCESGPALTDARCIFTNRKEHLENLTAAE